MSNSEEILSKNKSVYENAVTGIQWSCMLLLIGSCYSPLVAKSARHICKVLAVKEY